MQTSSQKSKIFNIAWQIVKNGHCPNISQGLKKAYIIVRMQSGKPTLIEFAKKDTGELRTATSIQVGSLDTVSKGFVRFIELIDGVGQWRSFNIANLIKAA